MWTGHGGNRDCPWQVPLTGDNSTEEASWKLSDWGKYYAECMSEAKKAWRDVEKEAKERNESRKSTQQEVEEEHRGRPRCRFGEEPSASAKSRTATTETSG